MLFCWSSWLNSSLNSSMNLVREVFGLMCGASGHFCVASWLLGVDNRLYGVFIYIGVRWVCTLCDVSMCIGFFNYAVVVFTPPVVCGVISSAQCTCCWCVFTLGSFFAVVASATFDACKRSVAVGFHVAIMLASHALYDVIHFCSGRFYLYYFVL